MIKKGIILAMITAMAMSGSIPANSAKALSSMTPYTSQVSPDTFYNGAMLDLKRDGNSAQWVANELENMKNQYNINTVNIYGLESFDRNGNTNKDALFAALKRLGMKVVVRIESYSDKFAFQVSDLSYIINVYKDLLDYVCKPENRGQVAYFSLNIPVDDPNVQNKIGGINSELSKQRQVSYTQAFVYRMRQETAARGFENAPMFLSIFYGWDNSFDIPSYASAGADGYFMNNYSYPKSAGYVPDETASDADLINRARLSISVSKFQSQYKGKPLVVEFGFHTMEYNGGKKPNQTAGLVTNRSAKARAIRATIEYYKTIPEFRGALYFGYNLYKEEGNPPAVMDWTLKYPDELPSETSSTTAYNSTNVNTTHNPSSATSAENSTAIKTETSDNAVANNKTQQILTTLTVNEITQTDKNSNSSAMKIWLGILAAVTAVFGGLLAVLFGIKSKAMKERG